MINKIKRHKKLIVGIVTLSVLYFLSRVINLTVLPIFTDEAIYVRWAQIAKQDSSWRFISLTDGKQPMLIWGGMVLLRFISDPLAAVRMVSVLCGFFSMIGIGLAARELFKSTKIGIFSSILYLVYPFTVMYDRMALMDSMVAMFSIWSLYLSVLLVKKPRLDTALILGMVFGGGVLTKTSGFLNIYLLPFTLLLFDWSRKNRLVSLVRWVLLALIAVIMSRVYYSVLRLSPWFHMVAQKDTTFIYPFKEWIQHPFLFFLGNMHAEFDWLWGYMTWSIIILILGAVFLIHKQAKEKLLLLALFSAPFVGLALFGKVLYPRFILFMTMPLLILAAWSLDYMSDLIKKKSLYYILVGVLLLTPMFNSSKIIFSIVTASIPKSDAAQYINDWPSGWGIREIVSYLEEKAFKQQIVVYTEGNFGLLPAGLEIYIVDNPNIRIVGLWPVDENYTAEMEADLAAYPVYYVSNQFQELRLGWDAELIAEYAKGSQIGNVKRSMRLWKLNLDDSHENAKDN